MAEDKNKKNPETETEDKEKFLDKAKRFGKEKALPAAKKIACVAAKVAVGTFATIGAVGTALALAHRGNNVDVEEQTEDQAVQDSAEEKETAEE